MNIKDGAIPIAIGKYSRIIISLLVNVILSRILTPEDYGVVAVVTVFTTFFVSLSDVGMGTAIIQMKDLTKDDINSIFSFSVYYSVSLTLLFSLLAIPIANFYNSKDYLSICLLLSISLFFDAMNTIPNGILNRNKEFKKIALRTVIVYMISAVIAIILAFCGFRFYALVFQNIISSIAIFLWNYIYTKPSFAYKINKISINKIKSYSFYQFSFNILVYFSRNLDNLLIGKFFGSAELGYYNKAYTLMLYPINNITNVISPVLHPILSDYQKEKEIIYNTFIKIIKILFIIGIIISVLCFLAADEIIILAFGRQWKNSIYCFKALSIAIMFQMVNGTTGAIYQALNNTKQLFINGLINSIITIIFIMGGILVGKNIYFLAVSVSIAYILQCFISFCLLVKIGFQYSFIKFIYQLKVEIFMLIFLFIAIGLFKLQFENLFISLCIKFIYILTLSFIYLKITREDKQIISILRI